MLYPIAAIYFAITYWTDKWLLLKYYLEPHQYDASMAEYIVSFFKYAFVLHFAVTYYMYKEPKVMEPYPEEKNSVLGLSYVITIVVILVLFAIYNCITKAFKKHMAF